MVQRINGIRVAKQLVLIGCQPMLDRITSSGFTPLDTGAGGSLTIGKNPMSPSEFFPLTASVYRNLILIPGLEILQF
jgi:hypothetical protein